MVMQFDWRNEHKVHFLLNTLCCKLTIVTLTFEITALAIVKVKFYGLFVRGI